MRSNLLLAIGILLNVTKHVAHNASLFDRVINFVSGALLVGLFNVAPQMAMCCFASWLVSPRLVSARRRVCFHSGHVCVLAIHT